MFFASAVFGFGEDGQKALGLEAGGPTGRGAKSAARARILDNYREPFVLQVFFHTILLSFAPRAVRLVTIIPAMKHVRNDFSHDRKPPGGKAGVWSVPQYPRVTKVIFGRTAFADTWSGVVNGGEGGETWNWRTRGR